MFGLIWNWLCAVALTGVSGLVLKICNMAGDAMPVHISVCASITMAIGFVTFIVTTGIIVATITDRRPNGSHA